jgi:ketosteroid isomerase-like protein
MIAIAQTTDDMATLKKLNATFIHNFVTNDTASHNRIIHRDFVYVTSNGNVIGRKEYLDNWAHGFDPKVFKYWDYRDEKIRIFGNTALVRSINKFIVVNDGKETTGMTIYTDTYVKENGEWKCVQAQITRLDEKFYRGDDKIVRKYVNGKIT